MRLSRVAGSSVALLATVAMMACGSTSGGSSSSGNNPINIGVFADITGPVSVYSVSQLQGIQLAVHEVDSSGGVLGHPIQIQVKDTASDAKQAPDAARALAADSSVLALIAGGTSDSVLQASPVAGQLQIPMIASSSFNKFQPGQLSDWTFRCASTEVDGLKAFMSKVQTLQPFSRLAIIYDGGNAFPTAEKDTLVQLASSLNYQVVDTEAASSSAVDYSTPLTKIAAAKPDLIWNGLIGAGAAAFMIQARARGISTHFVGGQTIASPSVFSLAKAAGEGTYTLLPFVASDPNPNVQAFDTLFQQFYGKAPDSYNALGYAAAMVLFEAIKKTGKADRSALRTTLTHFSYAGPTGQITFNGGPNNVNSNWTAVQVVNGGWKVV